uniref:HAT C-terminal dimerisation domain-containing protein n=1 Tax=Triticum urartu TaxID=4572 RepID=A0A8R7QX52_TRIUA
DDDFDIIQWWHEHKVTYSVISILARDVLSVPVSSTSSESAFSLAGRILEERRTSLTPDMVRTLMTVKDGELARRRGQHTAENNELMATFEDLALEDEE